jgi:hypothetical protein
MAFLLNSNYLDQFLAMSNDKPLRVYPVVVDFILVNGQLSVVLLVASSPFCGAKSITDEAQIQLN